MSKPKRPSAAAPHDTPCLAAVMQGSPSEIYLIDAATLQFVDVNAAARANLQYDAAALAAMTPFTLAPQLTRVQFGALLAGLGHAIGAQVNLHTEHRRRDGTLYPLTLRLLRADRDGQALLIAIGEDMSAPRASAAALEQVQSHFNAIVSNTPGLVYQFRLGADGAVAFPYLSDGCQALLGLTAAELQRRPDLFLELILVDDRKSYLDSMQASRASLWSWNWEGRIWVDAWKDVKWINLRSSPRAGADAVQWEGIMTNITESRLEQLEVQRSRARLAELSAHADRVKEQERTRIAREIHDDLGGNLTAIKMALAMLAKRLPGDPDLAAKAAYLDQLVDRSIDAVHRISLDLRPSMLDLGIVAALEWQSKEFETQAGLPCHFASNQKEIELDLDQATALFRIFQEALTNIAKHANASRVTVRLARLRHHISLKITDNGGGIWQADRAKPKSFGIRGMAERANALGGTLTLSHAAGGGTVVAIKIKLATPRATIIAAAAAAPASGNSAPPV
ncbi:PAS domain-containing sensor histidine kinase [Janthinobacterium sp. CG_S6]|uniref:PAS domain-containing sensor histidine kinase n=1 Tax=Janthinobacterium sp. CG_S6 TaxID=3071707 RepID=UPI002DFD70E5|nr:two-component system sensor histidine kinase UhpB [Janthinobacterium sp. CG_S6]